MDSTVLTSMETMLLRDGMQATFIGMDAQFGGSPAWVLTASGASLTAQVCSADRSGCTDDLCTIVDYGAGGTCVSPLGTCTCGRLNTGDRCETRTCCSAHSACSSGMRGDITYSACAAFCDHPTRGAPCGPGWDAATGAADRPSSCRPPLAVPRPSECWRRWPHPGDGCGQNLFVIRLMASSCI